MRCSTTSLDRESLSVTSQYANGPRAEIPPEFRTSVATTLTGPTRSLHAVVTCSEKMLSRLSEVMNSLDWAGQHASAMAERMRGRRPALLWCASCQVLIDAVGAAEVHQAALLHSNMNPAASRSGIRMYG